jgi:hypothetical protein
VFSVQGRVGIHTCEDGMDRCSEMLVFKLQMPVNHPEESIQHSEHNKSLKLIKVIRVLPFHPVGHSFQNLDC